MLISGADSSVMHSGKLFRFTGYTLLALLGLLAALVGFLLSPPGEAFVTGQVNAFLKKNIRSPAHIGRISYGIPDYIQLDGVDFRSPNGDTLLIGRRMRIDIDMWGLLQNRFDINQVELDGIRLNIRRTLPDTAFNFQHIVNAFMADEKPTARPDTASAPMDMKLAGLTLNDVRIRYTDDVLGTSVRAYVDTLRAEFTAFNPDLSRYHLRHTYVSGLGVFVKTYPAARPPQPDTGPAADTLDLQLGHWQANRLAWEVQAGQQGLFTKGLVGHLLADIRAFSLGQERLDARRFELNHADVQVALSPQKNSRQTAGPEQVAGDPAAGWKITGQQVRLLDSHVQYDDNGQRPQPRGMDYAHLDISGLGLEVENLVYSPTVFGGRLRNGAFREKSGFSLSLLSGDVLYSDKSLVLSGLQIRTPQTLLRDRLRLVYPATAAFSQAPDRVAVDARLLQSRLAFRDVLLLVPSLHDTPPFAANPNEVLTLDGTVTGTLDNLIFNNLTASMQQSGLRLRARGSLQHLTDPAHLQLNLGIDELQGSRAALLGFLPKNTLPDNINLPPGFTAKGQLHGPLDALDLDLELQTDWGRASFDGLLKGYVSGKNQVTAGRLKLQDFDAQKWVRDSLNVGKITGEATVELYGLDPKTMRGTFDVALQQAAFNGYTYRQVQATGNLAGGVADVQARSDDPNARLSLDTKIGFTGPYPSLQGTISLTEIDLQKLNFYQEPLVVRGDISLDMASTDPEQPLGTLRASRASVTLNGRMYPIDSLYLHSVTQGDEKVITLTLPFLRARVAGRYPYTKLYDIVMSDLNRYFEIKQLAYTPIVPPYDFDVAVQLRDDPLLRAFVPELTRLDPVLLKAHLDSKLDTTLIVSLQTGVIEYDSMLVSRVSLRAAGRGEALQLNGVMGPAEGGGLRLSKTVLAATAAHNRLAFNVAAKDSVGGDRHGLAGVLSTDTEGLYRVQLNRQGLLTSYKHWYADTAGALTFGKNYLRADDFRISTDSQYVSLQSTEAGGASPIRLEARKIDLSELVQLVNQDTTLVDGRFDGNMLIREPLGSPYVEGSAAVSGLAVYGRPLGDLVAGFDNADNDQITVEAHLSGQGNDANLTGYYSISKASPGMDLLLNLERLNARTIEAFSFGQIRRSTGELAGQLTIRGTTASPEVRGSVRFDSLRFNIAQNNATYAIDHETLQIGNSQLTFSNFTIRDSLNQQLVTNGTVNFSNLSNVGYSLGISARDFLVLNASRKDNDYVYGRGRVTASLNLRGSGSSLPSVNGAVKVSDDSDITFIMPDNQDASAEADQTVIFIDHSDSLSLHRYLYVKRDSSQKISFDNQAFSEINLNVEVNDKSKTTIIIDELNGDYLEARGTALLNVSISPTGDLGVVGRYDVTSGKYALNQVIRREFDIQKGGYIQWTGDPLRASLSLAALYSTTAVPADLVANQTSGTLGSQYRQRIPFNVVMNMKGTLNAPEISFDIQVPETGFIASRTVVNDVNDRLAVLRSSPAEMNKQVFALLVLNGFLSETSNDFLSNLNAEEIARSSVSKILTEQLNRMASDIVKGVDLNFALNSSSSAYGTGSGSSRTDLNIGLSKSLMQGRLTISVGRNFVLENTTGINRNPNEIFDNVSVNYNLTRDGRYMLRAYRRNEYQTTTTIEGYVVENGLSFIVTADYDALREIFRRDK